MKTAMFYGGSDIRLEECPKPEPIENEVLIKIHAAGICGSDLHRYRGYDPWAAADAVSAAPYRAGHEFSGCVAGLGAGVNGFDIGDRVAIEPMQLAGCGACIACRQGANNRCLNRPAGRRNSAGFSQWDVASAHHLHPFDKSLDFDVAALADVYACAVHALHRIPVVMGANILIIGTGAVALAVGQAARGAGAHVIIVGRNECALTQSRDVGAADETINATAFESVAKEVRALTGGHGADVAFEVVGGQSSDTLTTAIDALIPGGRIGVLGAFEGNVQLPYRLANRKEIHLSWSNGYARREGRSEFSMALQRLASGDYNGAPLVTHRFPLDDIALAFETANNKGQSGAIKVMIRP